MSEENIQLRIYFMIIYGEKRWKFIDKQEIEGSILESEFWTISIKYQF